MTKENKKREEIVEGMWQKLKDVGFVKSTNSVTGEEELHDILVEDREETIYVEGEFDKPAFEEYITQALSQREEEVRRAEKERQYELLMSCLPKDAENLSTLTPDQALRLIKKFINKNPWD